MKSPWGSRLQEPERQQRAGRQAGRRAGRPADTWAGRQANSEAGPGVEALFFSTFSTESVLSIKPIKQKLSHMMSIITTSLKDSRFFANSHMAKLQIV